MTKDIFACMRESQAVRTFKQDDIPEADLTRIIEAACWAPSAGNLQPWYFYVVKNERVKAAIAEVCFEQEQIEAAPVCVVIMADPAKSNDQYGERGAQLYCLQDTAAAAENMILAADALEIGSCWVGAFDERKVQQAVEAPPRLRAVAIICLGYSNEQGRDGKERYRVAEVTKIIH
ncbi:nitroreductase family protein|uniref:Nitroreductase n=1 Tax=Dendrosporobacter quercicolus TaxID=146817 RepID=A0A1G9M5T2_9FIRM|nr:nitroreductase family protein [Dendrosporobacter quercicolus]NSL46927.1 nitroreductase family protein [Dendrosporobacter quercicolus DSM 1736]SDL69568.1 Nitroreductase [Dendrosporobacter quercicolus]